MVELERRSHRATRPLIAGLMLAGMAIAQDLPPGVLLLSRVKRHMQEELEHLPNISCVETIERDHKLARGKMQSRDTVRLEVLTDGHQEYFASPGDRRFSARPPISFAGSGTLGDGVFGLYLKDILLGGYADNVYKGEETMGGRSLARYDYRMPSAWGSQTVRITEGAGAVGFRGSFWVDPEAYEIRRLELYADEIPTTLPISEMFTRIEYARTDLGNDTTALLPVSSDFRMVKLSGEIAHNRTAFSQCRVYGAQSNIQFGTPDAAAEPPRFGVSVIDDTLRPLPAGLEFIVKLRTRITSDTPVGTLIEGVGTGDAPVRGRIRRLEHFTEPAPFFIVALEYTEVELQGIRYRFSADVEEIGPAPGVSQTPLTLEVSETRQTISFWDLPGVATFFVRGTKLSLPRDFRTVWKTRRP